MRQNAIPIYCVSALYSQAVLMIITKPVNQNTIAQQVEKWACLRKHTPYPIPLHYCKIATPVVNYCCLQQLLPR